MSENVCIPIGYLTIAELMFVLWLQN